MADVTHVGQRKERLAQQARVRMPFNPLGGVDITGANVERLTLAMASFGWQDPRFITQEQAEANGWTIPAEAGSVQVTVRDGVTGAVSARKLYNAGTVLGMPTLDAMLAMSESELLTMRGDVPPEPWASISQETEPESPHPDDDEVEIGPAVQPALAPEHPAIAPSEDLFFAAPMAKPTTARAPGEQVKAPSSPAVAERGVQREGHSAPAKPDEFAVMAPYWLDGLHNFEGVELAKQVNRLVDVEGLAKDRAAIATLLSSYPNARRLALDIVPRSRYLDDPYLKANPSEPRALVGGELVRDEDGGYRPRAGGTQVLRDKGKSLVLKTKSELAYRGAMELAVAKGWKAIELKGNPKMMAQAWLEAKAMGLDVVNYTPTDHDQEKLAQRMAEAVKKREAAVARAEAQTPELVEVRPVAAQSGKHLMATVTHSTTTRPAAPVASHSGLVGGALLPDGGRLAQEAVTRSVTRIGDAVRGDVVATEIPSAIDARGNGSGEGLANSNTVADREIGAALGEIGSRGGYAPGDANTEHGRGGRLVSHGAAPFDHTPTNSLSYFVDVETEPGVVKSFWGKDLQRSLAEAGAEQGDHIVLAEAGRVAVVVEGKPAHRVNWETTVVSRGRDQSQGGMAQVEGAELVSSGTYFGPIVRVEPGRIGQKAGRDPNNIAWHDTSNLVGTVPSVGDWAEITYDKGLGHVKAPEHVKELSR